MAPAPAPVVDARVPPAVVAPVAPPQVVPVVAPVAPAVVSPVVNAPAPTPAPALEAPGAALRSLIPAADDKVSLVLNRLLFI